MGNILSQIVESKKAEVERRKQDQSVADLQARIADLPRPRNLYAALMAPPTLKVHLIAEIKKASPSRGLIRADFDPPKLAKAYAAGGALKDEASIQISGNIIPTATIIKMV